jgi:hypothetical protein
LNLATFRVQYPEFRSCADPVAQAFLDASASELNDSGYLDPYYDQMHGLLTAHQLSQSPNGQQARLQVTDKAGKTTYWNRYCQLREELTAFDRVF